MDRRRRLAQRWWPVLVAATVCALVTVVVAATVFPGGSANLDEVAYEAQGASIATGGLTLPADQTLPSFRPYLSGVHDDHVVFKYQPLWPALIGFSERFLATTLVLRALVSFAGVLAAAWFTFELVGSRRAAVFAAVLFTSMPLVWLQSATLLGYFPSLVLLLGASAALLRASSARSWRAAVLAGALIGVGVLHRPFDAILATLPVALYAVVTAGPTRRRRLIGGLVLGGLPFLLVLLAYNWAVMGSPLRFPFGAGNGADIFGFGRRSSFVPEGASPESQIDYTPSLAVTSTVANLISFPLFLAAAPALVSGALLAAWQNRRDRRVWLLAASAALLVVGYGFWWGTANTVNFGLHHSLGPLYHVPLVIPIVTLAAWSLDRYWDSRRRWLSIGCGLLLVANAPLNLVALDNARQGGRDRASEVAGYEGPSPRVVITPQGFPDDPYVKWPNDPHLTADVIVAVDVESERLALVERFPDRKVVLLKDYRTFNDPFGPLHRVPVEITAVRSPRIAIDVAPHPLVPAGDRVAFLLIDGRVHLAAGPTGHFTVDAHDLATATSIETGLIARTETPDSLRLGADRLGCRLRAGSTYGIVTVLVPCEWSHHYLFPDGKQADSLEDLGKQLQVAVRPAA